jgi:hypothetical protein
MNVTNVPADPQAGRDWPHATLGAEPGPPSLSRVQRGEQPMWAGECDRDGIVPTPFATLPWLGRDLGGPWVAPARRASPAVIQDGAARGVPEDAAVRIAVAVAPAHQGVNRGPQVSTTPPELVDLASTALGVVDSLQQSTLDQAVQAVGEDGLWNVQVGLKVVEAADSVEGVSKDQQRPTLPHDLQCAGEGTVLPRVVLAKHDRDSSGCWFGD